MGVQRLFTSLQVHLCFGGLWDLPQLLLTWQLSDVLLGQESDQRLVVLHR